MEKCDVSIIPFSIHIDGPLHQGKVQILKYEFRVIDWDTYLDHWKY